MNLLTELLVLTQTAPHSTSYKAYTNMTEFDSCYVQETRSKRLSPSPHFSKVVYTPDWSHPSVLLTSVTSETTVYSEIPMCLFSNSTVLFIIFTVMVGCHHGIHCWLPTSSYPDGRYRNHMGVAHSCCYKLLIECVLSLMQASIVKYIVCTRSCIKKSYSYWIPFSKSL